MTPRHDRPDPAVWPDHEAAFYSAALAQSDYGTQVGDALLRRIGARASLLDIGAGDGLLGNRLVAPGGQWTAVEPNGFMQRAIVGRAAGLDRVATTVLPACWEDVAGDALPRHEAALCANLGGWTHTRSAELLASLRPLVTQRIAWVTSAQDGPRTFCLSGLLPAELHGQDTRPGYLYTLENLGAADQPDSVDLVDWTFRYAFPNYEAARAHFADRLKRPDLDHDGTDLDAVLRARVRQVGNAWIAEAPKRSAVLVWDLA